MIQPCGKNGTCGEALLASIGLLSFLLLAWQGKLTSWEDVWVFTSVLGIIALFYFLLLLIKAVFTFMTGSAQQGFWWEKYEEEQRRPGRPRQK